MFNRLPLCLIISLFKCLWSHHWFTCPVIAFLFPFSWLSLQLLYSILHSSTECLWFLYFLPSVSLLVRIELLCSTCYLSFCSLIGLLKLFSVNLRMPICSFILLLGDQRPLNNSESQSSLLLTSVTVVIHLKFHLAMLLR